MYYNGFGITRMATHMFDIFIVMRMGMYKDVKLWGEYITVFVSEAQIFKNVYGDWFNLGNFDTSYGIYIYLIQTYINFKFHRYRRKN